MLIVRWERTPSRGLNRNDFSRPENKPYILDSLSDNVIIAWVNDAKLVIEKKDGRAVLSGALSLYSLKESAKKLEKAAAASRVFDLGGLETLDTAGALFLRTLKEENRALKFENISPQHQSLIALVNEAEIALPPHPPAKAHFVLLMEHLGKGAIKAKEDAVEIITFFGRSCVELVKAFSRPRKLRIASITHHIEDIGINAIPIVGLIAFLISIVLAYQGIAQLRPLGAEQFTVNLIAISVLREMGVLLTAIMVAGRSGSAFTAEIGVMKLREEVDALRAIGLDPFQVLVVPRLIALIIALPLLTFIANMMGLLGGAVLSLSLIGISLPEYMDRVQQAVKGTTFFVGMIKAPVFAMAIGVVGCMHGMKVSGSSESVGRETTASVVKSIFLVLMLDAAFSILFEQLKI